jgi:hypothetical protein
MSLLPGPQEIPVIRQVDRGTAIQELRAKLLSLTDDQTSMCQVAAERGIFCHGFKQYSDEELRDKFDWITRRNPNLRRRDLEKMANLWQLSRQVIEGVCFSCDAQTIEHDTCLGWDSFSNEELQKFFREIMHQEVDVVE